MSNKNKIENMLYNYESILKGWESVKADKEDINKINNTNYNWNYALNFGMNQNIDYDGILDTKESFKNALDESLKYGVNNFNAMISELEFFFNY